MLVKVYRTEWRKITENKNNDYGNSTSLEEPLEEKMDLYYL